MTDPKERESLYNESENFIRFLFSFYCNGLQKTVSKTSRRLIIPLFSISHESLFFLEVSNWIPKNEVSQSEVSLSSNHFAHVSPYHTFFRANR